MKELRHNMRLIGALVVVAFVGLSAWFALTVFEQGGIWASTSYNTRLNASGAFRGDILDRNGTTLATTVDGQRVYADSAAARRALAGAPDAICDPLPAWQRKYRGKSSER